MFTPNKCVCIYVRTSLVLKFQVCVLSHLGNPMHKHICIGCYSEIVVLSRESIVLLIRGHSLSKIMLEKIFQRCR